MFQLGASAYRGGVKLVAGRGGELLEELEMSLTERLRLAALERAQQSGHQVDGYVLEPTGVIDLREMELEPAPTVDNTVKLPPLDTEAGVDGLYGKPLAQTRLWKRVRGTVVPIDDDGVDDGAVGSLDSAMADAVTVDVTEDVALIELDTPATSPTTIDSALDAQPTRPCQRCGAVASRDLIDIFNSIEYYSCDDCGHMWQQRKA